MSITINTNLTSIFGMLALNKSTCEVSKSLERLSTGFRINHSKDDAAGSAISVSLSNQISSYNMVNHNAQTAQAMINTACGGLNNIQNMLTRIRDLAVQSSNGAYSLEERKVMQMEADNLLSEIYRVKSTTTFSNKQILGTEEVMAEEEATAQGYTVVKSAQELKDALKVNDENCKVMLFNDINLDDLGVDETGSNWITVGTYDERFKGTFDGNGFSISNLKINKSNTNYQGLFGYTDSATIKNINLENVDVKGKYNTGGLVGMSQTNSTIENCSVSGNVRGTGTCTGGLVGNNDDNSTINNCSSSVNVTGTKCTGGLVGDNDSSKINNCYASGSVIGNNIQTGGLVGLNYNNGIIDNCSSSSSVTGTKYTGGLVGVNQGSTIKNSATTSSVQGTTNVSAFIGYHNGGDILNNEYNPTINIGVDPIAYASVTESQIKENTNLDINNPTVPTEPIGPSGNLGPQNHVKPTEPKAINITKVNLQVGITAGAESEIEVDTGIKLGNLSIDITTVSNAQETIDKVDKILSKVINKQVELGAVLTRLDSAIQLQTHAKTALQSTNSIIKDTDYAQEASNLIQHQILQQVAVSLITASNQSPSMALRLLNAA